MDLIFTIFPIFFFLVFGLFLVMFISTFVRGTKRWHKNNQSPRLTVMATVISRRQDISHHRSANDTMHDYTSTRHYVTFQVESGDRMELQLPGQEYGLLMEGDYGRLTFQGTRYLSFERECS